MRKTAAAPWRGRLWLIVRMFPPSRAISPRTEESTPTVAQPERENDEPRTDKVVERVDAVAVLVKGASADPHGSHGVVDGRRKPEFHAFAGEGGPAHRLRQEVLAHEVVPPPGSPRTSTRGRSDVHLRPLRTDTCFLHGDSIPRSGGGAQESRRLRLGRAPSPAEAHTPRVQLGFCPDEGGFACPAPLPFSADGLP